MSLGIGGIQTTKNTSNLVADALRSAILQGKLESGQALKQDEIASEFSVSKIPVREALVQLQAEGLVHLIPSRGAMVSELTLDDVKEIYKIRIALETMALRTAIPQLKRTDFAKIDRVLVDIDHAEDKTRWAELNWEFHEALYRPANLPRLLQITCNLHNNVARYLLQNYLNENHLAESQRQHRAIVDACKQGDENTAISLLEAHLDDPVSVFSKILQDD